MTQQKERSLACPVPKRDYDQILMAHGGGGTLMQDLIRDVFVDQFDNPILAQQHDAATVSVGDARLAFTTDSFVVQPLTFPGGDIGSLAVHGTVNDLAMAGARPLYLSAGFILEEGLDRDVLEAQVQSMQHAAANSGVVIATGDTKVVERGKGDGMFINTAGIGLIETPLNIGPQSIRPGDAILVNGDLGRHGMAILAKRESLAFESEIVSDSAPVAKQIMALLDAGIDVHCLRDLTRGGLSSALNELAAASGCSMHIREQEVPVQDTVRAACELFGFDPLYVANEGRFAAIVPDTQADRALAILREHTDATKAQCIGSVIDEQPARVTLRNQIGATRLLDTLSGEQLPRIC
jgi:hydrogenase expression/formation protein HypE